jgi:hypothetical protein
MESPDTLYFLFRGKEALITPNKMSAFQGVRGTCYLYQIQATDTDERIPLCIMKIHNPLMRNYWGAICTKEPLDFGDEQYLYLINIEQQEIMRSL